jgi:hypothetical protein
VIWLLALLLGFSAASGERMQPAAFATYPVDLRVTPTLTGVRLRLSVRHPATHAIVRTFSIVHERPMHLFLVGAGLEYFTHDDPVQQPDGVFMLDVPLPRKGPYMAIAAFVPARGTPQVFQQVFTTGEAFDRPAAPVADLAAKIVDGVRVSVDVSKSKAGEAAPLAFRFEDAASGAPVSDIEPYLGASAHLLAVPVDLSEAVLGQPAGDAHGPALSFALLIPRAGRYKLWIQFQRNGHVSMAAFVFDVP